MNADVPTVKEALEKALCFRIGLLRQCPLWQRPEDHGHMLEGLCKGG